MISVIQKNKSLLISVFIFSIIWLFKSDNLFTMDLKVQKESDENNKKIVDQIANDKDKANETLTFAVALRKPDGKECNKTCLFACCRFLDCLKSLCCSTSTIYSKFNVHINTKKSQNLMNEITGSALRKGYQPHDYIISDIRIDHNPSPTNVTSITSPTSIPK